MGGEGAEVRLDLDAGTEARVRTGRSTRIRISPKKKRFKVQFVVAFDENDPDQRDDMATLSADDGSYESALAIAEGRSAPGGKKLVFENVEPGKRYSLKIDRGPSGDPYFVFRGVMATEAVLAKIKFTG
jgi:hypothetical protein